MSKKIVALFIIILIAAGGVYYALTREKTTEDEFTAISKDYKVKTIGWSGFETTSGKKLSIVEPEKGEEVVSFGYYYTIIIEASSDIDKNTLTVKPEITLIAKVVNGSDLGEMKFSEGPFVGLTTISFSRTIKMVDIVKGFEIQNIDKVVYILFTVRLFVPIWALDVYGVNRSTQVVASKDVQLKWIPPALNATIGGGGGAYPQPTEEYLKGYSDGYTKGYDIGWNDAKMGKIAKYTEKVPKSVTTYQEGYTDGFQNGYVDGYQAYFEITPISGGGGEVPVILSAWSIKERIPTTRALIFATTIAFGILLSYLYFNRGRRRRRKKIL